ncbi:MAG: hypothetical protein H6626_00020 [Pseudobdellovibrionaceae bacterium]|nr:hypothetical protein [Bdellovibrionales bacterium]USN47519.1 MAG: hypothetical protein H6626_00020 [Pseudobdellovibrionaceae bacterium]
MRRTAFLWIAISIAPFFLLTFFNHPSADDFVYAVKTLEHGLWRVQAHYYLGWSGRYMSTLFLTLNPFVFGHEWSYPLMSLSMLLVFLTSLWALFNTALERYLEKKYIYAFCLGFFALYLAHLPRAASGFYWLAGYVNYMVPLVFLNLAVIGLLKLWDSRSAILWVPSLVIYAFFITGANETIMLIFNWVLVLALVAYYLKHHKIWWPVVLVFVFNLAFSVAVVMAPGNAVRTGHFPNAHQPLMSVVNSVAFSLEHFFRFLSVPLILVSIVFAQWILDRSHLMNSVHVNKKTYKITWVLLGSFFLAAFFPAAWAMGGPPPERVDNMTYYFFLLFWFALVGQYVHLNSDKVRALVHRFKWLKPNYLQWVIVIVLFVWGNTGRAWYDLLTQAYPYHRQMVERDIVVKSASKGSQLIVPPIVNRPRTIFFDDIIEDPADWRNVGVSGYYGLGSIRVAPDGK